MTTERRAHARGKASVDVGFTDASSETSHAGKLYDLGRGGMFVVTDKPLPVGKRIEFEIKASEGTVAGMGRVIWVREAPAGEAPAGMGIKFIDVDDEALLTIDRISGLKKNVRERTVLGIAPAAAAPVTPAAPAAAPAPAAAAPAPAPAPAPVEEKKPIPRPSWERTVLGLGLPATPNAEPATVSPKAEAAHAGKDEADLSWPDEPPPAPSEPKPAVAAAAVASPAKVEPAPAPAPAPVQEAKIEPAPAPAPAPVVEAKAPAPEPVVAKAAEPEPPVVTKAAEPEPAPRVEAPKREEKATVAEAKPAPEPEPVVAKKKKKEESLGELPIQKELPERQGGSRAWLYVILLLLIGGGAAAYVYRDKILPPEQAPAPPATPTASAPAPSASASESAALAVADAAGSAAEPSVVSPIRDASPLAATTPLDASAASEAHLDAGADAAQHDAGHHDAGHVHEAPKPKPKPKPSTEDNPY